MAEISDQERVTVLIVEDDPTLLSTLAFNLVREGYRVPTARDGEQGQGLALALAEAARLDLVLLDVMLAAAGLEGDAIRTIYGAGYRFLIQSHDPVSAAERLASGGS